MKKILLLLISILLLPAFSKATHIMGGYLESYYVKEKTNRAMLKLVLIRNCEMGEANFDATMEIGMYVDTGAVPVLLRNIEYSLASKNSIPTDINGNFYNDMCMEQGTYGGTIDIPDTSLPYIFIATRCCRPWSFLNLQQDQGNTYFCRLNGNADPLDREKLRIMRLKSFADYAFNLSVKGQYSDSIRYTLVHSFDGGDVQEPRPDPKKYFEWPKGVKYNTGFDPQSLGANADMSIDPVSGILTGRSPVEGNYSIGIAINFYKKGKLTSIVRQDLVMRVSDKNPDTTTVSVETNTDLRKAEIPVYPTVTSGIIKMELPSVPCIVDLLTLEGQRLTSNTYNGGNQSADLKWLEPGLYVLRITTPYTTFVHKVIKN